MAERWRRDEGEQSALDADESADNITDDGTEGRSFTDSAFALGDGRFVQALPTVLTRTSLNSTDPIDPSALPRTAEQKNRHLNPKTSQFTTLPDQSGRALPNVQRRGKWTEFKFLGSAAFGLLGGIHVKARR